MKNKILLLVIFPLLCIQAGNVSAQDDSTYHGIQFEKPSGWQQILEKAKSENKYIFVDFYATWCGPCKLMDKNIYPSEKVGQYLNARFVSVRMQVDSSDKDDAQIRSMYGDVYKMVQQYNIHSYPSYLFFSPEGKILHRDMGYRNDSDFISLAINATDPNRQVYTLLDNYTQGKKNYKIIPYLSAAINEFDKQLSNTITDDYINNYLLKLSSDEFFTKENIYFIGQSVQHSNSTAFSFVLHHSVQADSIIWRDYAENIISFIIKKEEIDPLLRQINEPTVYTPQWNKIAYVIKRKYGNYYAGRTILDAKLQWYMNKAEWHDYCNTLIHRVEEYGPFGPIVDVNFQFNLAAWDLFLHSTDKKELIKALAWSDSSLRQAPPNVQCVDTHANLLYKLGKKYKAIEWEQKALDMENRMAERMGKAKGYFTDTFSETLTKMKNGEPTW